MYLASKLKQTQECSLVHDQNELIMPGAHLLVFLCHILMRYFAFTVSADSRSNAVFIASLRLLVFLAKIVCFFVYAANQRIFFSKAHIHFL